VIVVNIYDAKTNLSRLIERFQAGEKVVIARNGTPVVRFAPVSKKAGRRRPIGFFHCDIDMSAFHEPIDGMEKFLARV